MVMALSAGPGSQVLPRSIVRMLALPQSPLVTAEATGDEKLAQSEHNSNVVATEIARLLVLCLREFFLACAIG